MPSPLKDRTTTIALLLLLCSTYLVFKNLDSAYLWDDEAETAIFARNWVQRGDMSAWDGRNLFGFRNGTTVDEELHSRQPPLMFYATAASFALLGPTTWTARLPFALAGLVSLWLLYRFLRRTFPDEPLVALYAMATMGLSMQFLLNVRQCRYYALCLLLCILVFDQYRRCMDKDSSWRNAVGLGIAAAAMFMAHYLLAAVFLIALAGIHLVYRARWTARAHGLLAASAALFLLCTVPYAVAHTIWTRPDLPNPTAPWYISRSSLALWYLRDINEINTFPLLALLGVIWVAWKHPPWRQAAICYGGLALLNTAVMGWLTPQPWHAEEPADVRYLIASLPFACVAIALVLTQLHRRNVWLAVAALAVLTTSNVLSVNHKLEYKLLLPAYLREIHQPYRAEQQAGVEALLANAKPNDKVMTIPSFESIPLIFYVGDRLDICCQLTGNSPLLHTGMASRLPPMLFLEKSFPEWVLIYGQDASVRFVMPFLQRAHQEGAQTKQYRYRLVETLGVYFKATQRSEMVFHSFGPKTDYDAAKDDVYLYHREDA